MDVSISISGVEPMPLRSFFGAIAARLGAAEAAVTDLSGVRIPALVTEQLGNAALDAAREAAQALKYAAQDASVAQAALEAAAAFDVPHARTARGPSNAAAASRAPARHGRRNPRDCPGDRG